MITSLHLRFHFLGFAYDEYPNQYTTLISVYYHIRLNLYNISAASAVLMMILYLELKRIDILCYTATAAHTRLVKAQATKE